MVVAARVKVAKTTAATFEEARKTCIKSKGDLFSPDTTTAVSDLSSDATTQGIRYTINDMYYCTCHQAALYVVMSVSQSVVLCFLAIACD